MKRLSSLITLLSSALIAGQAVSQTPGKLEPFGLSGKRVAALAAAQHFSSPNSFLYAVTEGDGVYRRALDPVDSTWRDLGLKGKKLSALDIQIWGAGPAIFHTPVVGVAPDFAQADSTLIYRFTNNRWVPSDSGIFKKSSIGSLASFASSGHEPPGQTFASGGRLFYRSNSLSRWWTKIFDFGLGWYINTTAVFQKYGDDAIWVGGVTEGALAWMAKSTDYGETWKHFYPPPSVLDGNACRSLVIHPDSADIVYAGMYGAVIKTTNGGKTWQLTGLEKTQTYFHGLSLDPFDLNHIYAGGTKANQWALWESFDAGVTWKEIPPPVLLTPVVVSGITSIVADRYAAGVTYIATLGHGVWKYQSVITNVNDRREQTAPKEFALEQNYPNPFSASGTSKTSETVVYYSLASPQTVKLEVYNVLGELVATLVDGAKPAGEHGIRWNARNTLGALVPAGIYFYRLHLGAKRVAVRKMILLH